MGVRRAFHPDLDFGRKQPRDFPIMYAMEHCASKRKRPKPGYEPIYVSASECWTSSRFIDHFLTANHFAVSPANRELVRVVMRAYPGPRPIDAAAMSVYLLRHFNRSTGSR